MSEEPKLEELDRLISIGKQKGFLTYDEVNDALPVRHRVAGSARRHHDDVRLRWTSRWSTPPRPGGCRPRSVASASDGGGRDDDDDDGPAEPIDLTPGPVGRTEDPVRLYLREMGRVALLTREGEIALAKRIEEGKNQVADAILSHQPRPRAVPRAARAAAARGHLDQGGRRRQRGGVHRGEGGEPHSHRRATPSAASTGSCASATSSSTRSRSSRPRAAPAPRRARPRAKPRTRPGRRSRTRRSDRQKKVLEKLRALSIGNQIIDREDSDPARRGLVQRLRDLLDDVERAERVIHLWTNGRRPSPED